jgi:hypothetical protein
MIIFRQKIFRRDEFINHEDIEDDPNLVKQYGNSQVQIEVDKKYEKDLPKLGIKGSPDRKTLDKLKEDVKKKYFDVDGPNGGDTHYLGDFSIPGKFHVFSKGISDIHRLNYRVYPPKVITDKSTKTKSYIQRVVLLSCYDHELKEGDYLNDKNLRARKNRMRGNAPYRKSESIMKKKKK